MRTDDDRQRQALRQAGFERHWRQQVRRGLALTPAQRLDWLESSVAELSSWVGRARLGRPIGESK